MVNWGQQLSIISDDVLFDSLTVDVVAYAVLLDDELTVLEGLGSLNSSVDLINAITLEVVQRGLDSLAVRVESVDYDRAISFYGNFTGNEVPEFTGTRHSI